MKTLHYICFLIMLCLVACKRPAQHYSNNTSTIKRIATMSCTHIGFIDALGQLDKVVAACNKELIYTPLNDSVLDLGDSMSPNFELLLESNVDIVFASTYSQDKVASQLEKLGLNVVYIDEWKEQTPLKRTGWIKYIGTLLGCSAKADSIYNSVEQIYNEIKAQRAQHDIVPIKLMTGYDYRGTWYMPAGKTYMGNIFRDANASYPYLDDPRTNSIPMTTEQILLEFRESDVWIGSPAKSLDELANIDIEHTWFKPYKNKQVYNWSNQTTETGGNNFWERGVVHPEEILEDLIHILEGTYNDSLTHYAKRLY